MVMKISEALQVAGGGEAATDPPRSSGSFAIISFLLIFLSLSQSGAASGTPRIEHGEMNQRARAALEDILSTEEFRGRDSHPAPWLRLLGRLLGYLPKRARWIRSVLEWSLYVAGVFATAAIVVLVARRFRRSPFLASDRNAPTQLQPRMDSEAAKTKAYDWLQRGNHRQAIRYLYLSLLLYLDGVGFLTYDAGKTNGEYQDEIHGSMRDEAQRFASLTLFFERKWYGMEKSSAGDFKQYEEAFTRLTGALANGESH